MKQLERVGRIAAVSATAALCLAWSPWASSQEGPIAGNLNAPVSVFATGLNNPRGLKFGPDHHLYVAEGGIGGQHTTLHKCTQVPTVGPYSGSRTGSRISRINANGYRETVADDLPSSQTVDTQGSLTSGVADVAFVDGVLYGLLSGAGCSHGVPSIPNGVFRVGRHGHWELINDLSAFYMHHPVKSPEPDDFEPDGTPYSMVAVDDDLYVVEPNHGELDRVTDEGRTSRVVDISASQGHIVPTSIAFHDGAFYVGNLNPFPIVQGSSKILKITRGGHLEVFATGFTTVLGVAFDRLGRLYVLENTVGERFPTPGTGRVLRVNRSGTREVVASGLSLPTAITFGPDGNLYVSNNGFGFPPHDLGQILKIHLSHDDD
ncbi:MAG: ScyD/ScyE family protein [Pseudomonadota bacterium]|nr:ScyD/ScyE family protein [Pseudomonadota bacterium]